MSKWIDISYAYIFSCIQSKNRIRNVEKCLHPDTLKPLNFITTHIDEYSDWPTFDHYKKKFGVEAKHYIKEGYSQKEIADLLKAEYLKDVANDLMVKCQTLLTGGDIKTADLDEVIQFGSDKLQMASTSQGVSIFDFKKALQHYREGESVVATWGFPMMNKYLGPITRGQYNVIYGAVSEGKSSFARLLACNISLQGKKVLYITLEETGFDSIIMAVAVAGHFGYTDIFDNKMKLLELRKGFDFLKEVHNVGGDLIFLDKLEVRGSLESLLSLEREYKPDIIFLDQITLFTPNGSTEEKEVTKVSRLIRRFCQATGVPMIALTQRAKFDKKKGSTSEDPNIADIGYSWAIPQDADNVLYVGATDHSVDVYRKTVTSTKSKKRKRYNTFEFEWNLGAGIIREISDNAEVF